MHPRDLNHDKAFFRKCSFLTLLMLMTPKAFSQQIALPRIDQMPNIPSPYLMRDWKSVARGYDSLVFNLQLTGQYLPVVWINTNTVNYPGQNSFGLHTVVGTTSPLSAEAINCLPAIIGASLAGIDKHDQGGYNWALMCQEWFNKRVAQNVYKNHPVDDMGDDWWYETMPNVFFYQLNDLYPGTGDFNNEFTTVADRWLQAVKAMGGSTTPWQIPNMDHRGWYLQTMTPYDAGVHEPEASGAIGWLLYNAWVKTGDPKYRIGSELAMDFLSAYPSNPSYELQLSYGTYLAARMNAELGTTYDVQKMANWCFDVGPLRSWGAMVGTWGANSCSGLIGEVNGSNDYAFIMNTFEQIGALVPMVRYDDRFARAIGKWALNAANAARLFYPKFLPSANQDSYQWANQYDSNSVIAHEALRQSNGSLTPYATGDAIAGGWGLTNLALYGSSHVGILGGIIDTTNVPMILKLDVLKTDYYHPAAYPTYLFFNPYDSSKSVEIDVGSGQKDLYDAVTNQFLVTGASGLTSFIIPGSSAALIVVTPSGGTPTYVLDKMLINDTVVDYRSGQAVGNYPPRIRSLAGDRSQVLLRDTATVYCTAADRDGDTVSYVWQMNSGSILGSGKTVRWVAPDSQVAAIITCIINDGHGGTDTALLNIGAVITINQPPLIARFIAKPRKLDLGATSNITCVASDADADTLSYTWTASQGTITGTGSAVQWTAPASAGNYFVHCLVDDGHGGQAIDSIGLEVRDFSQQQSGQLVAYYPFNGNANDASGNGNNGTVYGATLTTDRFGNANRAYGFNGTTNYIGVTNSSSLNFQQSITVNFWMKVAAFTTGEQYPISHGNWTNRWKVSISNQHLRWTVKTAVDVKDLDSESSLVLDSLYNVTVLYSGSDFEVYLNGGLDAFSSWSGSILTTSIDLTIGQVLPNDQAYNFHGVLDDIRIYNYALSVQEIHDLAADVTGVDDRSGSGVPLDFSLEQNYPNPFNPATTIRYGVPRRSHISLRVLDLLGRVIATVVDGTEEPGFKSVEWNAGEASSGVYFFQLTTPSGQLTRKFLLIR